MNKKIVKEFSNPNLTSQPMPTISQSEVPNVGTPNFEDLDKAYKNIKMLLSLLEPRSSKDTEILSLIGRTVKSSFAKTKALLQPATHSQNELPQSIPDLNGPDAMTPGKAIVNDENMPKIEETTSVAGGGVKGTAGGIKIDEPVYESKDIQKFRYYIRNLLKELYSLDKDSFLESSKILIKEIAGGDGSLTRSTGMNYLGRFFSQARPAIEKEYLDLQTDQSQRDSMRDNLIKLYTEFIDQLSMNSTAAEQTTDFNNSSSTNESTIFESESTSLDGIYFDDYGIKDPIKDKEIKAEKEGPQPEPNTEQTGAAAASRVFTNTQKQLQEIYGSLGDARDKDVFSQYLPKNVSALFKLLASQFPIEQSSNSQSPNSQPPSK